METEYTLEVELKKDKRRVTYICWAVNDAGAINHCFAYYFNTFGLNNSELEIMSYSKNGGLCK